MNVPAGFWEDSRLVYAVAAAAVALLLATIWLFRRREKTGRGAGIVCLILSIALHVALIFLVPLITSNGGATTASNESQNDPSDSEISFSTFDPNLDFETTSADDESSTIAPLPINSLADFAKAAPSPQPENEPNQDPLPAEETPAAKTLAPSELVAAEMVTAEMALALSSDALSDMFDEAFAMDDSIETPEPETEASLEPAMTAEQNAAATDAPQIQSQPHLKPQPQPSPPPTTRVTDLPDASATKANVPGAIANDFAARVGQAKTIALRQTGGDENTEAAVEAALAFLCRSQRSDGAWDPAASGAGRERAPLGMTRAGAGTKCESALTGLSLLALLGAGHTHQEGQHADHVYRGLAYLIQKQKPDGSLAGDATIYANTYSHGMAALAMGEAAAITQDPSAVDATNRAIGFTRRMQNPSTGGWRYKRGDPGDLSQLGWQAMVLDAGFRAGVTLDRNSIAGIERFLLSVRMGTTGGLASYRRGEAPSRTMTAEALATRLLIGEKVPAMEIREAENYLLAQLPGVGQDNYYYWYYATLALHQLQDDAWRKWNTALKDRLLSTQRPDGSWPDTTVWGGYGGTVYTTAMATLCLEAYYRHTIRDERPQVAQESTINSSPVNRR
ncbi:squalene--hopene cyclase [Rubripirellula amarantea]|nr:squalene--hopene cyclase [Rubripirellula amarantea]